jgi:ribosomal-protein-alanine N-acetyltransferase
MSVEKVDRCVTIRPLLGLREARLCARFMTASEPWVMLKRSYQDSLAIFSDSSKEIFVAVAEGKVVGFIVLQMHGAFDGTIQSVGVFTGWQRCGIGRRLIGFAEERIFSEMESVFICVSSFNPRAQKLYEQLGYKVIGQLPDPIVAGHAEVLMRKSSGTAVNS